MNLRKFYIAGIQRRKNEKVKKRLLKKKCKTNAKLTKFGKLEEEKKIEKCERN